ncbi:uncharacterized protein A4U43_C04F28720 [Asparagus officinalis]|uniref:Aminotransferase-like plant mobile domain-containing protein n=1 Tax=Asparagus officinalis TaxID=4686 RepID=A0A5P1F4Y0_ASPOF|nr:uncharacterized protein A4U43_C04F28720 [Asparagus officinalis]
MPVTNHRCYGWVHSSDKVWWSRLTDYVLTRWDEELKANGLYAAVRATMYGLTISIPHFLVLLELYNPDTNTFLMKYGELGLALHEMNNVSGLLMGNMVYQEYFPSNWELHQLKSATPNCYDTLWDLTYHYHVALAGVKPLSKKTKPQISLKKFADYLFRNLESNSGEVICELRPLTPSEINELIKKSSAQSYTTASIEDDFPAGTKFQTFLWHAMQPIPPMTLLAGYLTIWLKKYVVLYQSTNVLPAKVFYLAVQLAHWKSLSLLPAMIADIHRGLRQIIMSRAPRGRSPTASADGVLPSYAVEYPCRAFSSHAVGGRRDEYYSTSDDFSPIPLTLQFVPGTSTEDASSVQSLRKTDFLFGDSVRDPDAVFIDAEQWLHKNSGGFIYLPKIPRHHSLTKLRRQAVTREMSWRLTEEHESIHCGYITHQAAPGSSRNHIIGLRPGVLGLDVPPRNEFLASASTLRNCLVDLGREMPATRPRFYGWVHSLGKLWWTRTTKYVLSRWSEELHAYGLYAAIRSTMYGLPLKDRMPDRYETLWDLTCHYHIALAQSEPLAKRTKSHVSLKQFVSYLFKNLDSNSGEAICELATLTPSEVNGLLKKIDAHSYTISSPESGFTIGTKFKSFLWHATAPIRPMTLLAGYLTIWLKKCVVPYQSSDILPLEVLYPAVQLAYKKELSLLPVMVANIHRGLRQISSAFTRKESESPAQIPTIKVELPYTYLMAWFVLHRSDMMSVPYATDPSAPLLQLFENGKWEGRGFPDVRQQLQVHKCWTFSTCFPQFSGRYGECLIDEEKPRGYRTHLDVGCFNWLVNIRPGYLTFRVRNQCFIEPYLPCRFARQFGYDQLYVGNPRQQLRTHGGLVDGLRAWLWTVTGCTGAKFSLPSSERQLNLTFLSCSVGW